MEGRNGDNTNRLACRDVNLRLQDYLDGTLDKTESVGVFLHLRGCDACQREHDAVRELFSQLDQLPQHPVPEGFDELILETVPFEAYRAMEPIRRERVPVYLETGFLPAWLRAPLVRLAGLATTLASVLAMNTVDAPSLLLVPAVAGVLPEALVRVQALARRATLAVRRVPN